MTGRPRATTKDILDDIKIALTGPISETTGERYFDEPEHAEQFKALWTKLEPLLETWLNAKTTDPTARNQTRYRALRMERGIAEGHYQTVSQLVSANVLSGACSRGI